MGAGHASCNDVGMSPSATAETLNRLTSSVIDAAIRIHRALGPGLLESAYLTCLAYELGEAGVRIELQRAVPLVYRGVTLNCGYRADLVVERSVLIEVKAQEALAPIHSRQLHTYLRLGEYPVGLLLNFGAPTMKAGIKRSVSGFPE
jgi:GxxExxY protein